MVVKSSMWAIWDEERKGMYCIFCDEFQPVRMPLSITEFGVMANLFQQKHFHTLEEGNIVDYHSVIGGPVTTYDHEIKCFRELGSGETVAWITNRTGCVSLMALSESKSHPLISNMHFVLDGETLPLCRKQVKNPASLTNRKELVSCYNCLKSLLQEDARRHGRRLRKTELTRLAKERWGHLV